MNRLLIGGLAAILAAGGAGGYWWMTTERGGRTAEVVSGSTPPAAEDTATTAGDTAIAEAAVIAAPVVAAASPSDSVSIERGACFGPCPIYRATVYGDDRLVFEGRKFVRREGSHESKMAAGTFSRLLAIARRHDFASMDTKWPDDKGLNCPEPPTDLPTVTIAVATAEIRHAVTYYEGCGGSPAAERVEAMVADLDKALALGEWIGPREDWYGKRDK